jgi:hypothetical protein
MIFPGLAIFSKPYIGAEDYNLLFSASRRIDPFDGQVVHLAHYDTTDSDSQLTAMSDMLHC